MKQRIAAFTLIWAYVACALWLFNATPDIYSFLCLFPPGYFFVVGLFFGILHELPASRWPRLWVTAAVAVVSLEVGVFLYGGHPTGLSLGYIFATAILCAGLAAKALAKCKTLLTIGSTIGYLLALLWLVSSQLNSSKLLQSATSPDGAFRASILKEKGGDFRSFHIAPVYGWNGAFGRKVVEGEFLDENDDYKEVKVERFSWKDSHTIHLHGLFPKDLPASSVLLPIPIIPKSSTSTP